MASISNFIFLKMLYNGCTPYRLEPLVVSKDNLFFGWIYDYFICVDSTLKIYIYPIYGCGQSKRHDSKQSNKLHVVKEHLKHS